MLSRGTLAYIGMPAKKTRHQPPPPMRLGQAAELAGVSVDTVRRWADEGRLKTTRSSGGQRLVSSAEIDRLRRRRRNEDRDPVIVAQSARNRFPGVVTRIVKDRAAATVEVQAGPHRLLSLMTAEAVSELDLRPGKAVIAVVKATSVMVEVPS